jgi:RNAse (barnase) inhibitor barstar
MELILNGKEILNKEILFRTLKKQIHSNQFIGSNLDALWDVLAYSEESIIITITNSCELRANLGDYCKKLLILFTDLEMMNTNIAVIKIE